MLLKLKSHQRFGGVVPEVASRYHIEVITQITKEALAEANATWDDIDAIAVTYGPGLVGALLIGLVRKSSFNGNWNSIDWR